MYTLSYMNNFNSEPQQQGKPSVPETKGETIESIAKKLQDVAQQIESVLSEIREANKQPNGPGTSGKLNALRNVFDSLTDEETALSLRRTKLQRNPGEKFDLVPAEKEDTWAFTPRAKSVDPLPLEAQKNQKRTLGNGSPVPDEFKTPNLKTNKKGDIEFV